MFFYELREGDDDIFADVLLVREEEMDADSFFELVQEIRRRIQDSYEQETLIEAIAEELERDYEFIPITDDGILRLEVYDAQTKPLIRFYEQAGLLRVVDADADVQVVFARLQAAVQGA